MGYCNYWRETECARIAMSFGDRFIDDVKSVILNAQKMGISICNGLGEPYNDISEIVSKDKVWINGDDSKPYDGQGINGDTEAHETFHLTTDGEDLSVKTNLKPYDAVVKAILVLASEAGYVKNACCDGLDDSITYKVEQLLSFKGLNESDIKLHIGG